MKLNRIACGLAACALCMGVSAQDRADRFNLADENSFSMLLLGDTQAYTKFDINQPILELCTAWCADNIDHLNVKAVLCTGDLVERNETHILSPGNFNQTSSQMWDWVSHCFKRLDNKVPYIISLGNHDYGYTKGDEGFTQFPDYFPVDRNSKWKDCLVEMMPSRMGRNTMENSAYQFNDPAWGKILVITTEWAPRPEVLDWAKGLTEKYGDHKVIFMTHSYLEERTADYTDNEPYGISPSTYGKQIWEQLVYPSKNIVMVICGHKGAPGDFEDSVAYRKDKNSAGHTVHQMMFNVQTLGGGWNGNGGDGWLRILEFKPDGKTISVNTYSPLFGFSPTTRHLARRTSPIDQFDMVID